MRKSIFWSISMQNRSFPALFINSAFSHLIKIHLKQQRRIDFRLKWLRVLVERLVTLQAFEQLALQNIYILGKRCIFPEEKIDILSQIYWSELIPPWNGARDWVSIISLLSVRIFYENVECEMCTTTKYFAPFDATSIWRYEEGLVML